MVLDARQIVAVREIVQADDFYRPAHQTIFKAIVEIVEAKEPVDMVSLSAKLQAMSQLEAVGGVDYLNSAFQVPDACNATYYARQVRECSTRRSIILAGQDMASAAYRPDGRADTILQTAQRRLFILDSGLRDKGGISQTIGEAAHAVNLDLENRWRNGRQSERRFYTGYHLLDDAIHGLRSGHLITLAGTTSVGKSALALNIAENVAAAGGPVVYISAEMLPEELAQRALQTLAPIAGNRVADAYLEGDDWDRLTKTETALRAWPFYIVGRAASLGEIASITRSTALRFGRDVALVVVDHLQLMRWPRAGTTREQVNEFTKGLKMLAMELRCPILLLSQLNREPGKQGRPPSMHDLKESGNIENDSNEVLLLFKPEPVRVRERFDRHNVVEVWLRVAKCRDGVVTPWPDSKTGGGIMLDWMPAFTKFENWSN